jgi:ABC-type metal ion transport system substrate-binding protein
MKTILAFIAAALLTSCVTSTTTRTEPDGTRTVTVTVTKGPDAGTVSAVASAAGNYAVNRRIYADK